MALMWIIVLSFINLCHSSRQFPPWFKFGAATAAHQVEGAWNVSDKSRSIWDHVSHTRPDLFQNHATGEIACDSYHQWKRDVQMASELGLHYYRFSISWTRLLPTGFPNHISKDGMRYYNNLIDELLKHKIEPLVTLYHFDLPQSLQDLGGWPNPLISEWFGDYARVAFTLFGDRVKNWITMNEPYIFCDYAFNVGIQAPSIKSEGIGSYLCNKNALLAHAKAWRIYDEEFRSKYNGKISINNGIIWFEPDTKDEEYAASLLNDYCVGNYAHPIFSKEGGWPKNIEHIIAKKSREEGYPRSRLPTFTEKEKNFIRGTYDYFIFNYYTSRTGAMAKDGETIGSWPLTGAPDLNVKVMMSPEWQVENYWFAIVPFGLRKSLNWIKSQYGDLEIIIGENGYVSTDMGLNDENRIQYIKSHLEQILLAIYEDGINVTAYTAWSLMDSFEWLDGYTSKFGMYAVDFTKPNRERTPRSSAYYYANVIRNNSLNVLEDYRDRHANGEACSLKVSTSFIMLITLFVKPLLV